jgi:hypothetical protein
MEHRSVCRNPWCKTHFIYYDKDIKDVDGKKVIPSQCSKCKSFNDDLSGGVTWEDKEYEGPRDDGMPHQIRYKITNYKF